MELANSDRLDVKACKTGPGRFRFSFIELVKMRGRILILSLIVLAYAAEEPTIDRAKNASRLEGKAPPSC